MMTFNQLDNGLMALDFACTEHAEIAPFIGNCKVQAMRNGDVYIIQNRKRKRNKAIFRDDNCSFSLGQDQRYYFVFSMPQEDIKRLPDALVRQAIAIAQKIDRFINNKKEVRK